MTLKQRIGRWLIPRLPVSRRTFDILRFEWSALMTRLRARFDPQTRRLVNQLRSERSLRLNLGSGGDAAPGWINIDIGATDTRTLGWDIRTPLPFADGSVARVCASHVIEHMEFRQEVPALLAQLFVLLEVGGRIRIAVPDIARYLHAYVSGDAQRWAELGLATLPDDMPTPMTMINHVFHQGGEHQFGYDFETLELLLRQAGFSEVVQSKYAQSAHFEASLDPPVHAPYSLYVEASKH